MGQAKARGSRDERAIESIARAEADARADARMRAANARQRQATINAMPEPQRRRVIQRSRERQLAIATLLAAGTLR